MEYGFNEGPETNTEQMSNRIGEQYLSRAAESSEQAPAAKTKHERSWPASAVVITSLLAVLLVFSLVGAALFGARISKLENAANDSAEKTADGDANSSSGSSGTTAFPSGVSFTSSTSAANDSETEIIQKSMKTVVSIDIMEQTSYGSTPSSSGSGVIISEDGYIATCAHVVSGASKIYVYLNDGTSYEAEIVSSDSVSDLAVIKVDATDLPYAAFADSGSLQIGEKVFAIGNMLGQLSNSCTRGCISGIDRSVSIDGNRMTLLQTDAAVNHGNSGGGLFRLSDGALVGIVNAKSDASNVENLGFAIPSSDAAKVVSELIEFGFVTGRPYLGIATRDVSLGGYGIYYSYYIYPKVTDIEADSPAEKAGFKVGDIILDIDGESVNGGNSLASILYTHAIGDTVTVTVLRGNSNVELQVTLAERTADKN